MRKERPILFSTDMVQAILEGRKTMTRRILKGNMPIGTYWHGMVGDELCYRIVDNPIVSTLCKCPYGQPGDILWVKETYSKGWHHAQPFNLYKADDRDNSIGDHPDFDGWKPSIFMPKVAARIFLEITDIRAERLQDITDEDAIREGIEEVEPDAFGFKYKGYDGKLNCLLPKTSFFTLFEKINGEGSYGKNPWLWVISFNVLSTTGRPHEKLGPF